MDALDDSSYLVSDRPHQRLEDHRDSAWVGDCERCRGATIAACARAGFSPRCAYAGDDTVVAQSLAAAGMGVVIGTRLRCCAGWWPTTAGSHVPRHQPTLTAYVPSAAPTTRSKPAARYSCSAGLPASTLRLTRATPRALASSSAAEINVRPMPRRDTPTRPKCSAPARRRRRTRTRGRTRRGRAATPRRRCARRAGR